MQGVRNLVGIDLGTSYSSVAVLDEHGFAQTVHNDLDEASTPSVVYFSPDGPVVGTMAERAYARHPDRVVVNSKRYLGQEDCVWEVDGVEYGPVDVAAMILRKLKADAESKIGDVRQAVITVPVHFNSLQRRLTLQAAEQAGLDVLEIANEPVAAALCHVLGRDGIAFADLAEPQRVLVYDLGGGTFDLSLVDYHEDEVRVLSANGDLELGGIDWNERLLEDVAEEFVRESGFDPRDPGERRAFASLARAVEAAKRKMSETEESVTVACGTGERKLLAKVDRKHFELLTGDLLDRTRMLLKQIVTSVDRKTGQGRGGWSDVNAMLLVGGSSRMPMVRAMFRKHVKRALLKPIDPELSVAHGAALYAGLITSKRDPGRLSPDALTRLGAFGTLQVNSLTLGMVVAGEDDRRFVHPLIPRDTPLPASARVSVATMREDQRRVSLRIVESGSKNSEVCQCVLDDLPPRLPAGSRFDVDLTYNPSGMLHVVARHRDTGLVSTVSVQRDRNGARQSLA